MGFKRFPLTSKNKNQLHNFTKKIVWRAAFTWLRAADFSFEGRILFKIKACSRAAVGPRAAVC